MFRVVFRRLPNRETHGLVAAETGLLIDRSRIDAFAGGVGFRTGNKECSGHIHSIESCEIEIGFVHDVNGTRLENDLVEDVDLMVKTVGNANESRYKPAQIEQCMKFYRRFGLSGWCPPKDAETEIYSGRVECVNRAFDLKPEISLSSRYNRLALAISTCAKSA